ncbi:universal stress protein [Halorubrum halodurans]|uniref:Universal stress protein UspA n=1 Tax=Halorubrum halodurans TaxID=1383851 RepID=A0A256IPL1_9EURY|nr:universal stress protein [Halorubrum halodurans]OYR58226.1 universal stress protein UspA [Halorubrum halodurans]
MYDRILVPTDGGDRSLAAARRAFDLAERYGATVHALYVVETDTSLLTVSKGDVRGALRAVGEEAGREALAAVEEAGDAFDVGLVTTLREGVADEVIVEYVRREAVDLVVMGTHGREGVRRRLLGSVAERVVRGAGVPVMTVPADRGDDEPGGGTGD